MIFQGLKNMYWFLLKSEENNDYSNIEFIVTNPAWILCLHDHKIEFLVFVEEGTYTGPGAEGPRGS